MAQGLTTQKGLQPCGHWILKKRGLLRGGSSGVSLSGLKRAAIYLAETVQCAYDKCSSASVCLCPDGGLRIDLFGIR